MIRRPLALALIAAFVLLSGPLALRAEEAPNLEDLERRIEAAKKAEADKAEAGRRAAAQRADAERRKAAEAATRATLVLRSDAPCQLTLDGEAAGEIAAGTPKSVAVSPGQQLLACVSTEQPGVKYEQVITAQSGAKTVQDIALASAVSSARSRRQVADKEALEKASKKAAWEAKLKALCANSNPVCMEDTGNGILRQPATGLEWTQADNGAYIDWKDAIAYCAGKGTGWRLPSADELKAIVDKTESVAIGCGFNLRCNVFPLFHLSGAWHWSGDRSLLGRGVGMFFFGGLFFEEPHAVGIGGSADGRALCVRHP